VWSTDHEPNYWNRHSNSSLCICRRYRLSPVNTKFLQQWHTGGTTSSRYLGATGGALVPEKCSWYILRHKWEKDKWSLHSNNSERDQLTIGNDIGDREVLPQKDPYKAVKSLGTMFSPSGDTRDEAAYLREKGQH
jgi:hypothetical protein